MSTAASPAQRGLPIDALVVPALLLLCARDLVAFDPPRVLAWRLLHDDVLLAAAPWPVRALVTRPPADLDRDPFALTGGGLLALLAVAYLAAGLLRAGVRARLALLSLGALLLVGLPTLGFVAMGRSAERPYGQDGGVVQLPMAIDRLLAGQSPYAADYSQGVLGRQSRASAFWDKLGGNPITRHHAYLPGTHALMLPFQLASRAVLGFFDPRFVTLLAWMLAAFLAARLAGGGGRGLLAAAGVLVHPLAWWHQVFGANELLFVALLLLAAHAGERGSLRLAGAWLGLACATKQLAWPFAPFLLLHWSGALHVGEGGWRGDLRALVSGDALRRVAGAALAGLAAALAVILPVVALDPRAFYADVIAYNVGFGGDLYPFGGTPGIGLANFVLYAGVLAELRDPFPLGRLYPLLVPLGLLMVRAQLRAPGLGTALLNGSAALCASLYLSRIVHANYFVAAAVLLPLAVLLRRRDGDAAVVPSLLLLAAVEVAENGLFRASWEQARAAGLEAWLFRPLAALAPRAGLELTDDPLGLAVAGLLAGGAVLWLAACAAGASLRARAGLLAALLIAIVAPVVVVARLGEATGVGREESGWSVQATAAGERLRAFGSPWQRPGEARPASREAVSSSFRLEPPRQFTPEPPRATPGAAWLGALHGALDPRRGAIVGLALLALVSALAGRRLGLDPRLLAAAVVSPPMLTALVWGGGAAYATAQLMLAGAVLARGYARLGGVLLGAAIAIEPCAMGALPLLGLLEPALRRAAVRNLGLTLLVACSPLLLDPGGASAALALAAELRPGIGLSGLWLVRGAGTAAFLILAIAVLVTVARVARRAVSATPWSASALAVAACVVLAPGLPASALALPLGLLAAGAAHEADVEG
ncbi:MAG: hypothetical protein NDJ94_06975 [Vicinamibacteria bacterium]|nr:hypothetical protein [Vicinamibacteria bacterium]